MILGTQYYRPPFPLNRYWREDMRLIREAGLNTVQFWASWAWVEPEPGRFVFEDYDELFDEAGNNGLKVILSTTAELQPYWIHRIIPDSHMIDNMGNRVISSNRAESNQGLTPGGCTDNPGVLAAMKNYLVRLAERYKGRDNFLGWDCWNEFRWEVNSDGLVCYCPYTLASFREWLETKYGSLDGVNRAWNRRYCSFDDILPGKLPGRTYTEMMEFEAFIQWRQAQHLKFRYETLRSIDKNHIITAHGPCPTFVSVWGPQTPNALGNVTQQALHRGNDWNMAEYIDALGSSHFPYSQKSNLEVYGARVEATRAAAMGKPFWVSELAGGGGGHWGDQGAVDASTQQLWLWTSVARGAKAVNFWCWRDEVFGGESGMCGLAGNDGLAGERLAAMKSSGTLLKRYEKLLDAYEPDMGKVGLFFDPYAYMLEWADSGYAEISMDSQMGYLKALERIQVPYTVIESSHMSPLRRLKVLIMPWPLIVSKEAGDSISEFVKNGGTLIIEGEADAYTTTGFYRYPGEERDFALGLGIDTVGKRRLAEEAFTVRYAEEKFQLKAGLFYTPFKPRKDARNFKVISRNSRQELMAFENAVGRGTVISIGTFIGKKYCEKDYPDFERFLKSVIISSEAMPDFQVLSEAELQWHSGLSNGSRILFLINSGGSQKVTIQGPAKLFNAAFAKELRTNAEIPVSAIGGLKSFAVEMEKSDYSILQWN